MKPELLTLSQFIEKFLEKKDDQGQLPRYVRYCEGTDPQKNNEYFNKRLFIGDFAFWIDTSVATDVIKAAIEEYGYVSYADQRVPDGFGRNYDSTYYELKNKSTTL